MPITTFPITTVPPTADLIINTPAAPVTSTNVQAAINEIASLIPSVGPGTDPLFLTRGLDITVNNPNDIGDTGGHTFMNAQGINVTIDDNRNIEPGFKNQQGLAINMTAWHGDNYYRDATSNYGKTTYFPLSLRFTSYAAGQRFLIDKHLNAYGMGDSFIESLFAFFSGGPGTGDEGQSITPTGYFMSQTQQVSVAQIYSATRALGNTTLTQFVPRSRLSQTVTVASTGNINVGEWYVLDQQNAAGQYDAEAIKIEAVGPGTITAKFRADRLAGVTITPALVLVSFGLERAGQLRVIVNLSGAVYNTGTVTDSFGGTGSLHGSGTTWATNMVGGSALNIGAIALAKDTYTGPPFSFHSETLKSWYEIKGVTSTTSIGIHTYSQAGDQGYHPDSGWPTNYEIRPAVRILWMVDSSTYICETTTTAWTAGDTIECAISPYPDVSGMSVRNGTYTAGGVRRGLLNVENSGVRTFQVGLSVQWYQSYVAQGGDAYGFQTGMFLNKAWTGIALDDLRDTAIDIRDSAGAHSGVSWPGITWGVSELQITKNKYRGVSIGVPGSLVNGEISVSAPGQGDPENLEDANGMQMVKLTASWLKLTNSNNGVTKPYIVLDNYAVKRQTGAQSINYFGANAGDSLSIDQWPTPSFTFGVNQFTYGGKGFVQHVSSQLTLANGVNGLQNIVGSFVQIIGPTGAFSVDRFQMSGWFSGTAADGAVLYLFNSTANAMTIKNEAFVDSAAIRTMTGADVVLRAGTSFAKLIYSLSVQRWILVSTN